VPATQLLDTPAGEASAVVRARVVEARERTIRRQGQANQALQGAEIDRHAQLDAAALQVLHAAASRLGSSSRGTHRALKLARTIADLAGAGAVQAAHVAEAVQYPRALSVDA